jgi:hypothetical protein
MMKFNAVTLFLCLLLSAKAQEKVFIPERGEGISFNTSSLMIVGADASYIPSWRANSQEMQFLREHHLGLSHFGVAYGIGYSGHFYHGNLHVNVDSDGTQSIGFINDREYASNRFATEYLDGIIEFRFRSTSNNLGRYTRLYIGGVIGYLADSYSYFNSDIYRVKFYNLGGFSTLRYGTYVKFGRGPLNLYYYYGLNPIVTSGVLTSELETATSQNIGFSVTL